MRDWLSCGHMAFDKCNVSPGATSKQLLPSRKKMAALNLQVYKCFFKFI